MSVIPGISLLPITGVATSSIAALSSGRASGLELVACGLAASFKICKSQIDSQASNAPYSRNLHYDVKTRPCLQTKTCAFRVCLDAVDRHSQAMAHCCVPYCTNDWRYSRKSGTEISFHRFPAQNEVKKKVDCRHKAGRRCTFQGVYERK